jgi:glutamate-1-semialdehyde 2,1-aminomutase
MALLDPTDRPPRVISGGTFSGNPLTMAAGLAAMEAMTPSEYARLDALGDRLRREGNALLSRAGVPGQITGDGSLFRIMTTREPIHNYRDSLRATAAAGTMARIHRALLDEGIIVSNSGLGCLSTPMGDAEVDAFLNALEAAMAAVSA